MTASRPDHLYHSIARKTLSIVLSLLFFVSAVMTGTYAWRDYSQHKTNVATGGISVVSPIQTFSVLLNKFERDADGSETEIPVEGAEFCLYKVNEDGTETQIGDIYPVDDRGQIIVNGLEPGEYYFLETNPSYGYTYDKTTDGEDIKEYPFTLDGTGDAVLTAYNSKVLASLIISKTVTNEDGSELTEEQLNTPFLFAVTFSGMEDGQVTVSIDNEEKELSIADGKLSIELKHGQTAVFENLPLGIQYTVTESNYFADGYDTYSTGSSGTITEEDNTAEFTNVMRTTEPEPEYGSLTVTKSVQGEDIDTTKEFTFTVTLDGVEQTIVLKDGESHTFENIPVGTSYSVVENDYYDEGYITTSTGSTGTIIESGAIAEFINTKEEPQIGVGTLTVKKEIAGTAADPDMEFSFTVTIGDEEQTIKLKGGEEYTFEDIPVGTSYSVTETDYYGEGYITESTGAAGTVIEDGSIAVFTNTKDAETEYGSLTVKKIVTGEGADKTKEFTFTITMDGEKKTIALKDGEDYTIEDIPVGTSYSVVENDYFDEFYVGTITGGSGTITAGNNTAEQTNTYIDTVYVEISGEKTWDMSADPGASKPDSIIVYLKNGGITVKTATVTPDGDGKWMYTFEAPKYDESGAEIEYTVEEEPVSGYIGVVNDFDITNTRIAPAVYEPVAKKTVSGDKPAKDALFTFKLTDVNGAPMPDSDTSAVTGEGETTFGEITYRETGVYTYTVTEVKGDEKGYDYDETVYTLTVTVEQNEGKLEITSAEYSKPDDIAKYSEAGFINTYIDEKPGTTSVKVTKVWADDDSEDRPQNVQVQLYADGEAYDNPVTLNAQNNWTYTWTQLDENVTWTVDEPNVPEGYNSAITGDADAGFVVTNTKEGASSQEKVTINGSKTWDHGNLDSKYYPESITVLVKNGDQIVIQRQITATDNWSWSFELDKYDDEGQEINYTIDEQDVSGYIKTIVGYNLINTYNPDNPVDPSNPDDTGGDVNTGDSSNVWLWIVTMILSLASLIVCMVLGRKSKRRHIPKHGE